ncbi:MAG: hypothetical protein RR619_03585, partial [Raoultibacter sp.]
MPKGEDVTTKFRVDISELKANITAANKAIKSANASFKEAASGMDDWESSTTGLEAKIKQMTGVLGAEKIKLESYEQQLSAITAAEAENGKRADELRVAYKLACEQFGKNSNEAKQLKTALSQVELEQVKNRSSAEALTTTISGQTAKVNKVESELGKYEAKLSEAQSATGRLNTEIAEQEGRLDALRRACSDAVLEYGKGSAEAGKFDSQIRVLSAKLQENKQKLADATDATDELTSAQGEAGEGCKSLGERISIAGVALGGLFAAGVSAAVGAVRDLGKGCLDAAMDYQTSISTFQSNLGVSTDEAKRFADIGRSIYNGGWGESMAAVNAAVKQAKDTLRDVNDEDLATVTQGAMVLASTMDADVNESIRGINALMKGFGLSATEATDLYTNGMQRGLNYTDELGDNLSEYSVRWGEAGVSAQDYFSLLQAGTDNGAYNLDKVGDYLNEFLTSLSDGRMDAAMANMSQGTQDVFTAYKDGGATAQDVLNAVIGEMGSMINETDRAALAGQLWSSLGEDNAMGMILSLGGVQNSYGDVAGAADAAGKAASDNIGSQATSAIRTLQGMIGDKLLPVLSEVTTKFSEWVGSDEGQQFFSDIGTFVGECVTKLTEFGKWIMDNQDAVGAFFTAVGTGLAVFKGAQLIGVFVEFLSKMHGAAKLAAAGQLELNFAQMASPIGLIIGLIAGLVAGFIYLWNTSDEFRNFWIGLWEGICSYASGAIAVLGNFFMVDLPAAGQGLIDWFTGLPAAFQGWWLQITTDAAMWVATMVQQAQTVGMQFIERVVSFFTTLPHSLLGIFVNIVGKTLGWSDDMIAKATNMGQSFIDNVIAFLSQLPGNFSQWFGDMVGKALTWAVDMAGKAEQAGMWEFLLQGISMVLDWAPGLRDAGRNAIDALIAIIRSNGDNLPGIMMEIGSNIVQGVWQGIQNAAGWFSSQ